MNDNIEIKKILSKAKSFFNKAEVFLTDHIFLLFKSAAENHLRIQECKVKSKQGEACNLSFGSYSELKRYQKKVRLFTYSTSSTMASVLIAVLIMQIFFQTSAHGAT